MNSNADDVRSAESLNSSGHVQCGICNSSFRRPEHLKRHMRSHTKEKPFECNHCGRYFSRTDTLHRHSLSHHNSDIGGRRDRMHRITVKTFRACFSCAGARVRCSGGNPCERCTARSFDCIYPTERRSKAKSRETIRPSSTAEERSEQHLFHVASQREPRKSPGGLSQIKPCSFQTIQFSINGNNAFIQESFGVDAFSNASELHGRRIEPGVEFQMSAPGISKHSPTSSTPATAPSMACPGQGYLPIYQDKCYQTLPESFLFGGHDFPPEVEGPWLEISNPGSFLHLNVQERAAATSDLDVSFFDESLPSTKNWMPGDLEDNQSQIMHSFCSHSGPGIPSTLWYPTMMLAGQRGLLNIDEIPETSSGEESLCTDMDGSVIHFHGSNDLSLPSKFESRCSSNSLAAPEYG